MDLLYFAILCSVLIFVHELGHFVFAKIFGVTVLTSSIGFGPKIVRLRDRETETDWHASSRADRDGLLGQRAIRA